MTVESVNRPEALESVAPAATRSLRITEIFRSLQASRIISAGRRCSFV